MAADKAHEVVRSWDRNAGNWTRVVREGLIPSRKAGTDAAILEAISTCAPLRLLDIGCGEGWLVRAAATRTGCAAIGIDGAGALIADARIADPVNSYFVLTHEDFADSRGMGLGADFDVITFNYSLFTEDIVPLLRAAASRLTPGGRVIIQTLHPGLPGSEPDGWRMEDFSAFAGGEWAAMPWYSRSTESWHAATGKAGLNVRETHEPAADGQLLSLLMICGRD